MAGSENSEKDLDILNHSTSHVMASAIKHIYPDVKFAIGPSIKNGFYYDIDLDKTIVPEDLKNIEKEMEKIIRQNLKFERQELAKEDAKKIFAENPYKIELIEDIAGSAVSIYTTGDFKDLC